MTLMYNFEMHFILREPLSGKINDTLDNQIKQPGSRQIIFKYLYGKILLNDMNLFLRQIVFVLDV